MQQAGRPAVAAIDPRWPRLRTLHLGALREDVDAPELGQGDAGERWSALLNELRREPARSALLTRVITWGLPDEDLLGWALLAARLDEVLRRPPRPSRALVSAERWMREPDETLRYDVFALAQAEEKPSPGTLAGLAAFSAGPSLAPRDAEPAPPPPGLARRAAAAALAAAAAAVDGWAPGRGFDAVNLIGLEMAAGGDGRAGARRALGALETARSEATA